MTLSLLMILLSICFSLLISCLNREELDNTEKRVKISDWEYGSKNIGELMDMGLKMPKYNLRMNLHGKGREFNMSYLNLTNNWVPFE